MDNRYLLNHIKKLEDKINEIENRSYKLQKIALNLKKLCQSFMNNVNKDMKDKAFKYINSIISNVVIEKIDTLYNQNGYLNKEKFFELMENIDFDKHLLFILKLKDSNEIDFASSFIETKFTPFIYVELNKIIGIIEKSQLKEFENTKFIPFFKNKYEELKFFVIFFEINKFSEEEFKKAINIFDRFYLKPSMSEKSFVHYSLVENKIIDFELVEKEKIKKEYAYINELKYPEIETLIRKEIKNSKFVLALLDRIDSELMDIKRSKGTIIVVKRILSFIHKYQLDPKIQEMTNLISQELERKETIKGY